MEKQKMLSQGQPEGLIRVDRMYDSLRYNDYSMENGLGEIVDNSVEAGAGKIRIFIKEEQVKTNKPGRRKTEVIQIAVVDDGTGMDEDTLAKCLVLGESLRPTDGKRGIGRFGVGMTLGSISIARRVEVFSRKGAGDPFLYTYIDLDEIREGNLLLIPRPTEKVPPQEFMEAVESSSGTLVILSKCDRVSAHGMLANTSSGSETSGLANYLGRTYRKFIAGGLDMELNGEKVYLHDPLYLMGPTVFDVREKGVTDPKSRLYAEGAIELPIPGREEETALVTIKLSLLPKEWRLERGAGGKSEAAKRKIDQNEGVSILRANREVLYGKVPYIMGKRGEASSQDIDRWWGCEISFPPELDDYFQVRYIKRGAEPIPMLLDKIRLEITESIKSLRKIIRADWNKSEADRKKDEGLYDKAEKIMAQTEGVLPRNRKGAELTEEESRKKIDEIVDTAAEQPKSEEERERRKAELRKKPYIIDPVKYPQNILFETDHALGQIIIHLNVEHPFYRKVLLPLCGPFSEESDPGESNEKSRMRDAFMLLLLSYAKAEAQFDNNETLFSNLRSSWGSALASAMDRYGSENG